MLETLSAAVVFAMLQCQNRVRQADALMLWQRMYVCMYIRCGNLDLAAILQSLAQLKDALKKRVKLVAAKNKTSCH